MKLEGAYVDGDFVVNCQVICDCGRHIDAGYGKDEGALDNSEGIVTCPVCGRKGRIKQKLVIEDI